MHVRSGALATALLLFASSAPEAAGDPVLSPSQAAEEVQLVASQVRKIHPDPFHAVPERAFDRQVRRLLGRKGPVTVAAQYFGLSSLLSMISDTHTQLHVTEEAAAFQVTYPLRFRIFPGGLYVIAGNDAYRDAVGRRIVAISGREPGDVIDHLARHSFADSRPRKRVFAEMMLYLPETYEFFDLKTSDGRDPLVEFARTIDESLARRIYDGVKSLNPWRRATQKEAME